MPAIADNLKAWSTYDWKDAGDEWSSSWGGTEYLWIGTILPRIRRRVPTGTILEIAPGFGRCTSYLKDLCNELYVVDLTERCIDACRQRFSGEEHIRYFVNDGRSLDMIPDRSVDFVFTWDSLVHADAEVLRAYTAQLARVLKPEGGGFIHHSNLGSLPPGERDPQRHHFRGPDMTAALFREFCDRASLRCVRQELVPWGTEPLIDCFSLFCRADASWAGEAAIVENHAFMSEAKHMRGIADFYDPARPGGGTIAAVTGPAGGGENLAQALRSVGAAAGRELRERSRRLRSMLPGRS